MRISRPPTTSSLALIAIAAITLFTSSCAPTRERREAERKRQGVASAKQATRYLRDLQRLSMKSYPDPAEFDRKWRWAWQEAAEAKATDFDQDIVDNLYCSLAAFGGFGATGTGVSEAEKCMRDAERALRERYGR